MAREAKRGVGARGTGTKKAVARPGTKAPAGPRLTEGVKRTMERICGVIREDGVTNGQAALLAEVEEEWLKRWMKLKPEFRRQVAKARAEYQQARRAGMRRRAEEKGDWRGDKELLESMGKERETGELPGLVISVARLEELQARWAAALRTQGGGK